MADGTQQKPPWNVTLRPTVTKTGDEFPPHKSTSNPRNKPLVDPRPPGKLTSSIIKQFDVQGTKNSIKSNIPPKSIRPSTPQPGPRAPAAISVPLHATSNVGGTGTQGSSQDAPRHETSLNEIVKLNTVTTREDLHQLKTWPGVSVKPTPESPSNELRHTPTATVSSTIVSTTAASSTTAEESTTATSTTTEALTTATALTIEASTKADAVSTTAATTQIETVIPTTTSADYVNIYEPVTTFPVPTPRFPTAKGNAGDLENEPLYQKILSPLPPSNDATSLVLEDELTTGQDFVRNLSVGQQRTLWKKTNRVIDNESAKKLNEHEKGFQEVKFEILTSEASYQRSLNLLKTHFMNNEMLAATISREDFALLFFHIKPIRKCSKEFQGEMDNCWNYSVYLLGLFDVVNRHAQKNFNVYVKYCSRLKEIQDKLKSLSNNKKFSDILSSLENSKTCSFLTLDSFLSLPLTRITRLPLLLQTALDMLTKHPGSFTAKCYASELNSCIQALDSVRKITERCDRDTKTTENMQRMIRLRNKLVFPQDIKQLALISPERWLELTGDVKCISWREYQTMDAKKSKAISKKTTAMRLYLLNDMMIFTKPTNSKDEEYKVLDYCNREHIRLSFANPSEHWNTDLVRDFEREYKILMNVTENHEHKRAEMVFSCIQENDRNTWVKHFTSEKS